MIETTPFSQPTRQSSVAIIFILGRIFKILVRQLWVVILVILFNPKKQMFNGFTLFFLALAAVGAIMSIIAWFNYFFYIKNGELRLEKGVLRKSRMNVPLDRIQTINFKQTILHQFFNVVSIEIDTAGSAGKEFSLQALKKEQALALRDYVENYKAKTDSPDGTQQGAENQCFPRPAAKLLFRLSPSGLLKIGVSQNHLRTAGIIMAFFVSFIDDFENALGFNLGKEIEKISGMASENELFFYLLLGIPFFLMVSFFFTLVRTVFRYFDLQFWRTARGFKMVSGLFTRHEVSASLSKIQFVRWGSSPLNRVFSMVSVRMLQAASVQVGRKLAVNVPGCYHPHLAAIRQSYFPEENELSFEKHGVHARIILRQMAIQGLLPAGLLILLTFSWLGSDAWIWALWLVPAL
ncbi:MAG: PH domain-containing protein, partial [Saprospiraceae bacterium]